MCTVKFGMSDAAGVLELKLAASFLMAVADARMIMPWLKKSYLFGLFPMSIKRDLVIKEWERSRCLV